MNVYILQLFELFMAMILLWMAMLSITKVILRRHGFDI